MGDPNNLRDRLDALLKRAREISAEIERRVESVTGNASPAPSDARAPDVEVEAKGGQAGAEPPVPADVPAGAAAKEALSVATEAVAVSAEAAAVTAEALSAIANDAALSPPASDESGPVPTTVAPDDSGDPSKT